MAIGSIEAQVVEDVKILSEPTWLLLGTIFTGSKSSCHGVTLNLVVSQLNFQLIVLLVDGGCGWEKLASVPYGSIEVCSLECMDRGYLLGMGLYAKVSADACKLGDHGRGQVLVGLSW